MSDGNHMRALKEAIDSLNSQLQTARDGSVPQMGKRIKDFFDQLKEDFDLESVHYTVKTVFEDENGHRFGSIDN